MGWVISLRQSLLFGGGFLFWCGFGLLALVVDIVDSGFYCIVVCGGLMVLNLWYANAICFQS
jgi:hypothetical protein